MKMATTKPATRPVMLRIVYNLPARIWRQAILSQDWSIRWSLCLVSRPPQGIVTLIGAKDTDRVGEGCLSGLKAYSAGGNDDRKQAGKGKYPPGKVDMVRNIFQPLAHEPPRYRRGNDKSNDNQDEEVFREHGDKPHNGGAQYLSYTDFAKTGLRHIGGKAKQTQTGDENSHSREKGCKGADVFITCQFCRIIFFNKEIFKRIIGVVAFEYRSQFRNIVSDVIVRV